MAILSGDKKSVTVEKNDTLSQIALDYKQYIDRSGNNANMYQYLASINGISNPNLIYVGQVIKLTKSSSSSSSNKTDPNKATITAFGLQSNSDNTLFATWKWDKKNTEKYETSWKYDTGDGVWFENFGSTEQKQSTYGYPSNAKRVKFNVKPVSKTRTVNGKESKYWSAGWSTEKIFDISDRPPVAPPTPSDIQLENFKLTVTLDNLDIYATHIQFQIVKDNNKVFKNGTVEIKTGHASYSCAVNAGSDYKVRCRGVKGKVYGQWSDYSSNYSAGPGAPSGITVLKALSDTSIHIEWGAVKNAETYEIQYTTKTIYFDASSQVQSTTVDATLGHHYIFEGLQSGEEYFFRVRACIGDQVSAWTPIKSLTIGKKPIAPTTWSSTTTVVVGEKLTLYWVHNSQDGSSQTYADLVIIIDGVLKRYTIENSKEEDEKDKTSFYEIDTTNYPEGCKIEWKVRTAGITKDYGDWSIQRTINVYAPPTLTLSLTRDDEAIGDVLTRFPFVVHGVAGPETQSPIGYYLTIVSDDVYETVDNVGNAKTVNKGEVVYSAYFNEKGTLTKNMSAGDVNLENNMHYTVKCIVSMNSGLTAEASEGFTVLWDEVEFDVNAEISIDDEIAATHIRPYCERVQSGCFEVVLGAEAYEITETQYDISNIDDAYTITGEKVYMGSTGQSLYYCITYTDSNGDPIDPRYHAVMYSNNQFVITTTVLNPAYIEEVYTTTGEAVLVGYLAENDTSKLIHYCIFEERVLVDGISLAVYRREFDGGFTEIASGINNTKGTFVTDPHPALDFARYRIVGIDDATGSVSYTDLPGIPMNEKSVIIQWEEQWSTFDTSNEDPMEQPPWSGSLLRLPYNIDVSDSNSSDVSLVKYIGRKHPVAYYGTQLGTSSSWNVEIDKRDEETIYALRRLAMWMGDVYVREPSGSGYWASISVSFSQKHCEVTIPVSFSITRVEGGV